MDASVYLHIYTHMPAPPLREAFPINVFFSDPAAAEVSIEIDI